VFRLVVDELPLPGEQPLVFKTLDRLARTKTQIAGKNVHQFVLRAFSWNLPRVLADFRETTSAVIPGRARLARASDAQLRIGESIPPRSLRPNGLGSLALLAP